MGSIVGKKGPRLVRVAGRGDLREALQVAAGVITRGGLVAFPTESFYGLGADPRSESALAHLHRVKARPGDKPLLLLIPGVEHLEEVAMRVPAVVHPLAERFWPGGLTIVVEAASWVSQRLTAGTGKIGVRVSGHPLARGLCRAVGGPVTGTSANVSGEPPCASAEEVLAALGGKVDLVLDGGRTPGARPSTVLDVTVSPLRILREGMITKEALAPHMRALPAGSGKSEADGIR